MGIVNFQKFIKDNHGDSYRSQWLDRYDMIYMDLNFLLHMVSNRSDSQKQILTNLKFLIITLLTSYPVKRIIMCADGQAPLAKMFLQRKRRITSVQSTNSDCIEQEHMMSLNFTPGSEFMKNLEKNLGDLTSYLHIQYNVEVVYDILNPDEGEVKIRKYVGMYMEMNPNDTHLIFSGDSDQILLLSSLPQLSNVYMTNGSQSVLSIGRMMDMHFEKFGRSRSYQWDFIFLNLLLGNDYLPKVGLVTVEHIWEAYRTIFRNNSDEKLVESIDPLIINPTIFHDLIHYMVGKRSPHLQKFNINDIRLPKYKNYIDGIVWCFGIYTTGVCHSYQYIYDSNDDDEKINKTINPWGVVMSLIGMVSIPIKKSPPINLDLYTLLLIPEIAKNLFDCTTESYKRVVDKFPIIYEAERCVECKNNLKVCRSIHEEMRHCNEQSIDDNRLDELKKEKIIIRRRMITHKKKHQPLTLKKIQAIEKIFINSVS